ncbi:MAG: Universal stress protein UspA and related nucleotide-binding protein [Anaerolineaceae bacterium]|nr:MAG: Universal stress protein UspA and related nucleotide-binding protein [Anaerolineaceae bacterium]
MVTQSKVCGRLLLADDGSEHARAAVALVSDLPLPPRCRVTVLRMFGSQQAAELGPLEEALAQTCAALKNKGLQADSELLLGSPAQKIVEYAQEHKIDLIVLGAKGLRATLGILLGGVAQQVVEYSACPVLVVRPPYAALRRVLLLTDGSANSQRAMEYFGQFPFPAGLDVRVMHVLPPPPLPVMAAYGGAERMVYEPLVVTEAVAAERAREEANGKALLERTVQLLAGFDIKAAPVLKRGDAATEIIEYIKDQKIDLTVSGSRGLSQIRSWLMGSVSRKLVHYSGCSTLVVRGPQPA